MASTIVDLYPTEKDIYIARLETAVGLGLMIGPPGGSLVYSYFGYAPTFYIAGACVLLSLIPHIAYVLTNLKR